MSQYKDNNESPYLKSEEFKNGITLEVVGVEKVEANEGYGGTQEDWLVKESILKEGQSFKYTFLKEEKEKIYETKSAVFFISFRNLDPEAGQKIIIKKDGRGRDTKYDIKYAPLEAGALD